jgi:hypothetical protein
MTKDEQPQSNMADVIDYYGDRQICDHCRATVSTYGDKCSVPLDVICEGFSTYEMMLQTVARARQTGKGHD